MALYAAYELIDSGVLVDHLKENVVNKIYCETQIVYLEYIQNHTLVADQVERLFISRSKDEWYSMSALYGGGPDNELVCDVEYLALTSLINGNPSAIPVANKTMP